MRSKLSRNNQLREIRVDDLMQKGYVCVLSEPAGKHFHPAFQPQLTPREMLTLAQLRQALPTGRFQLPPQAEAGPPPLAYDSIEL